MLQNLQWNLEISSWESSLDFLPGCHIRFMLADEGEWAKTEEAKLVKISLEFVDWARTFERQCRERVADDLLELYNESWADDDPDEGPPPLTRTEFLAKLRLTALTLHEAGSSSWDYACGDLFAGHGISIMLDVDRSFLGEACLVG